MGDCQNYGPFLGPYYNTGPNLGDPKRDNNFDNPPYESLIRHGQLQGLIVSQYSKEPGEYCRTPFSPKSK